jgi:DNA-binding transcriptional regulator YhcF (GntR family)
LLQVILEEEDVATARGLAGSEDLNPASVTAVLDELESNGIGDRRHRH